MRVRLGIVSETSDWFLNELKLCLYSLRKNGGLLKEVPVTLITNSEPLPKDERELFEKHFSPIEFITGPRLGGTIHTPKMNIFYLIDPESYDVLMHMDCDTVVRKPLDHLLDPIIKGGAQFVCRRACVADRKQFPDFDNLVSNLCGDSPKKKIIFEEKDEWPMFNSGVFLATPEAVRSIRKDSIEFTYRLFNEWQRVDAIESLPLVNLFYKWKILKTRKKAVGYWLLEQGAIALACIKAGLRVHYLDEIYNSIGLDKNFGILHCFKLLYRFDRSRMFLNESEKWINEYLDSEVPGKIFLAKIVREYRQTYHF